MAFAAAIQPDLLERLRQAGVRGRRGTRSSLSCGEWGVSPRRGTRPARRRSTLFAPARTWSNLSSPCSSGPACRRQVHGETQARWLESAGPSSFHVFGVDAARLQDGQALDMSERVVSSAWRADSRGGPLLMCSTSSRRVGHTREAERVVNPLGLAARFIRARRAPTCRSRRGPGPRCSRHRPARRGR
jgi:hypothetical protein